MTLDMSGEDSFDVLQMHYSSHGLPLAQTTKVEFDMGTVADTGLPPERALEMANTEAEFYKLESSHEGGNPKALYLHQMIREFQSGRSTGPLHMASTWLLFLQEASKSECGQRCGEFLTSDIMKMIRVSLLTNAANVNMMHDFASREGPNADWVCDSVHQLFSKVSRI